MKNLINSKLNQGGTSAPPPAMEARPRRVAGRKTKLELKPAAARPAREGTLLEPVAVPPVQGAIRMELAGLSPSATLSLLKTIKDGLTGNVYYPDFTGELTLLAGSENGIAALLETLASLEQQQKAFRAALETEVANAKNNLRSVGYACENYDRTDEALVSAGWPLRRIPGPPQPMTVPARLVAVPSRFTGELDLKWGRVANARYYETQAMPMELLVDDASWIPYAPKSCPRANYTLDTYAAGTLVAIRVRACGAKGPGPWSESINARVS